MSNDSEPPQVVWVVEKGCYDEAQIVGVYSSASAAMAANQQPGENWKADQWGNLDNGLDWINAVTIWREVVRDAAPQALSSGSGVDEGTEGMNKERP